MISLLEQQKAFFKKTRRGKIARIVQEKYLRQDLNFGYLWGKCLSKDEIKRITSEATHKQIIVVDTNALLHQIDVFEHQCSATGIVVVLQTVLQEIRHRNLSVYKRVSNLLKDHKRIFIFFPNEMNEETFISRLPLESPNDYNDKLIRLGVKHYQQAIVEQSENSTKKRKKDSEVESVILLSNDMLQRKFCTAEGIDALSLPEFVSNYVHSYPELSDLLVREEHDRAIDNFSAEYALSIDFSSNEILPETHITSEEAILGIKTGKYYRGVLQCRGDLDDCYVIVYPNKGGDRLAVSLSGYANINRAVSGDTVAVEIIGNEALRGKTIRNIKSDSEVIAETAEAGEEAMDSLPQNSQGLCGKVVSILRRSGRQYAGRIDITQSSQGAAALVAEMECSVGDSVNDLSTLKSSDIPMEVLFIPVDKRIPPIRFSTHRIFDLIGQKLLVGIDFWSASSKFPNGHYIRRLGKDGDKEVETAVLLHEFGVESGEFTDEVMACLPSATWTIDDELKDSLVNVEEGKGYRRDFRSLPVVSIDPPGCKDIDDALHCTQLPSGNYEVGVHIADVTHFVHADSPLDKEAAHRSTSTYLVDKRLDMLPGLLTTQLCSLRSGEDHLAFSVIWELDENGNIVNEVQFCKSVIHSVASLTYDQAQAMLDADSTTTNPSIIHKSVVMLNKLAIKLRNKRIEEGALTLASPEVRFKLDEATQSPTDVTMYALKQANALVEEFMLLANITVSKKILRHFPTLAVLRRHQPPSREQFAPLLSAANAVGVHIDISTSKALADSLDLAVKENDPYFNKLLRILSTRCMMPAQYFCSGELTKEHWHHYGLAAPVYTHFTSPIRRYADVIVHRLLAAAIGITSLPVCLSDRARAQEQCSHMNRRHKAAQYTQRASVNLHTLLFFKNKPAIEEAYALSLSEKDLTVLVPRFGIEGSFKLDNVLLADGTSRVVSNSVYNSGEHTVSLVIAGIKRAHRIQVFQKLKVKIVTVEEKSGNRFLNLQLIIDK